MKKALIWIENYENKVIGDIEMILESSYIESWTHHLKDKMQTSLEIDENICEKKIEELNAVLINNEYIIQLKSE